MPIKVTAETENGGAVVFNDRHGAWASYAVAGVSGLPRLPILYANVKDKSGKDVQFFYNRDSGLIVVELIDRKGGSGVELLRVNVADARGRRWVAEPLTADDDLAGGPASIFTPDPKPEDDA